MRHVKAIVWFCAVGLATTAASVPVKAAGPTSTFDVDDEGWLIVNNGPETTPEYDSTGGNPGGYISSEDSVQGAAFWLAPSKFLGDMATAYNTGLSFDLKQSKTGRQTDAGDVLLTGGGLTVVFDTCYNPGSEWTHYGVPLHELAGWRRDSLADPAATSEDMLTVLSSLSELRIRADYHTLHADDYWGLDNVAMMACDVASIYAWGMENPMELAFDSDGYLYAGHSRNASRLSIYQIPPGGGQAVEYGQGAFSDPDGLDCDGADTVWIASGLWANVQDGEVKEIAANGTVSNVGTNYLTNPMSLEVDRSGRFGPEGSLIVANQRSGLGVEIFSVTPTAGGGADVTNVPPSLTDLVVAEDLSFDAEDTLWFVGNGQLYRWLDTPGAQPEPVPLPGVNGLLSAVGFDPYTETLVVGLADERRIIRVSLEGEVGEELAGCLDPQSFAFDAAGNIFVSDSVRDVIWRIGVHDVPEPPTLALLGIAVLGLFVYRRRTPCLCSTQLSGSCRKSPDSAGKSLKGYH